MASSKHTVKGPRKSKAKKEMPPSILATLDAFNDYVWGTSPEYPEELKLPSFVDKRESHEPKQADCTVVVGAVVMVATNIYPWTLADYRDLMLMDGNSPWSAVDAWSRATGFPVSSEGTSCPDEVTAVQGLSGLVNGVFGKGTTGHQWIEFNGLAWHLSRSGKVLTRGGVIPGYKVRKSVRLL